MPLAGCCSASIAAACQPSRLGCDASGSIKCFPSDLVEKKLKWGVVERPERSLALDMLLLVQMMFHHWRKRCIRN